MESCSQWVRQSSIPATAANGPDSPAAPIIDLGRLISRSPYPACRYLTFRGRLQRARPADHHRSVRDVAAYSIPDFPLARSACSGRPNVNRRCAGSCGAPLLHSEWARCPHVRRTTRHSWSSDSWVRNARNPGSLVARCPSWDRSSLFVDGHQSSWSPAGRLDTPDRSCLSAAVHRVAGWDCCASDPSCSPCTRMLYLSMSIGR